MHEAAAHISEGEGHRWCRESQTPLRVATTFVHQWYIKPSAEAAMQQPELTTTWQIWRAGLHCVQKHSSSARRAYHTTTWV